MVLTPPVIVREAMRLLKEQHASLSLADLSSIFIPSLLGMVFSFVAGLLALKWLSSWLESGRWLLFGVYCLGASVVVFALHLNGV